MPYCRNCHATFAGDATSCAACGVAYTAPDGHPDGEGSPAQPRRPRPASVAICFLYIALLPNLLFTFAPGGAPLTLRTITAALLLAAFAGALIYNISRGRNWARLSYVVVFLFSAQFFPAMLASLASKSGLTFTLGAASLVASLLELAALVLLFGSASNDWFRRADPAVATGA